MIFDIYVDEGGYKKKLATIEADSAKEAIEDAAIMFAGKKCVPFLKAAQKKEKGLK